jgi:fructokinase
MNKKALCFGEVLWDVLPAVRMPGGAPMNVAAHLKNFGVETALISRVGADGLGQELEAYLSGLGLPLQYIQHDPTHRTCQVKADTSDPQHVKYVFDTPTAWDFIEATEAGLRLAEAADIFVFGSLASRNVHTRLTLMRFLEKARFKVFDVNLRFPFIDRPFVEEGLRRADFVKLNDEELEVLSHWLGFEGGEEEQMRGLSEAMNIPAICLTRGEKGAWLLEDGVLHQQNAFSVDVVNTIGSGDAFLAAYLCQWIDGQAPATRLRYACAVGALVATYHGATPKVKTSAIEALLMQETP